MASRPSMPPRLVLRRIHVHVGDFMEWMAGMYAARGWRFGPVTPPEEGAQFPLWSSRDVAIQITHYFDDGRPAEIEVSFHNVPGVPSHTEDAPVIGWDHGFVIALPPEYPADLKIRIVNLTETVHPLMMPPDKGAPACIFPKAELDQVLREVLWNVLLKPDVVRPPTLFDDADLGFRPRQMQWYAAYGPQRLFDQLMAEWDARQKELLPSTPAAQPEKPAAPAAPFVIRSEEPATPTPAANEPVAPIAPPTIVPRAPLDLPPAAPPRREGSRDDGATGNAPFRIRD